MEKRGNLIIPEGVYRNKITSDMLFRTSMEKVHPGMILNGINSRLIINIKTLHEWVEEFSNHLVGYGYRANPSFFKFEDINRNTYQGFRFMAYGTVSTNRWSAQDSCGGERLFIFALKDE